MGKLRYGFACFYLRHSEGKWLLSDTADLYRANIPRCSFNRRLVESQSRFARFCKEITRSPLPPNRLQIVVRPSADNRSQVAVQEPYVQLRTTPRKAYN